MQALIRGWLAGRRTRSYLRRRVKAISEIQRWVRRARVNRQRLAAVEVLQRAVRRWSVQRSLAHQRAAALVVQTAARRWLHRVHIAQKGVSLVRLIEYVRNRKMQTVAVQQAHRWWNRRQMRPALCSWRQLTSWRLSIAAKLRAAVGFVGRRRTGSGWTDWVLKIREMKAAQMRLLRGVENYNRCMRCTMLQQWQQVTERSAATQTSMQIAITSWNRRQLCKSLQTISAWRCSTLSAHRNAARIQCSWRKKQESHKELSILSALVLQRHWRDHCARNTLNRLRKSTQRCQAYRRRLVARRIAEQRNAAIAAELARVLPEMHEAALAAVRVSSWPCWGPLEHEIGRAISILRQFRDAIRAVFLRYCVEGSAEDTIGMVMGFNEWRRLVADLGIFTYDTHMNLTVQVSWHCLPLPALPLPLPLPALPLPALPLPLPALPLPALPLH